MHIYIYIYIHWHPSRCIGMPEKYVNIAKSQDLFPMNVDPNHSASKIDDHISRHMLGTSYIHGNEIPVYPPTLVLRRDILCIAMQWCMPHNIFWINMADMLAQLINYFPWLHRWKHNYFLSSGASSYYLSLVIRNMNYPQWHQPHFHCLWSISYWFIHLLDMWLHVITTENVSLFPLWWSLWQRLCALIGIAMTTHVKFNHG